MTIDHVQGRIVYKDKDWIAEAEAACEAARIELQNICEGDRGFRMQIPAHPEDSDLVFMRAIEAGDRALAALRAADELAKIIGEIAPVKFGPDVPRPAPAYWSRANEALAAYRKARS